MFKNLINIITSPQEAFAALKIKPSPLLPLFLIIAMTAAMQWLYFANVDKDFYIDQTIEQIGGLVNLVPEAEIRKGLEETSLSTNGISAVISIFIMLPIVFSLSALYLVFISKFTSDGVKFKQWFALVVWTSVPLTFSALAGIISIVLNTDGLISQASLQALSLNSLIFHSSGPFQSLLNYLTLDQLWSLGLLILGYQHWTGKPLLTASLVNLVPYLFIYGIWALIIIL